MDPIVKFGADASAEIIEYLHKLPQVDRKPTLRKILDAIDKTLWTRVQAKATQFQQEKGYGADTALERALASSLAYGLLKETVTRVPKDLGCSSHDGKCAGCSGLGGYCGVGSLWDDIWGGVKKGVNAVVSTVGGLACKAVNSTGGAAALTAGGILLGVPPGASGGGIGLAQSKCSSSGGSSTTPGGMTVEQQIAIYQAQQQAAAAEKQRQMLTYLLFGGVGLGAIFLLTRK